MSIAVQSGTVNGGANFQCTNTGTITIGTTSITWVPISGVAGYGISGWTAPIASGAFASLAIGSGAVASGAGSIAIGVNGYSNTASAVAGGSIAIGGVIGSTNDTATIVIGQNSSALAGWTVDNAVVIGGSARGSKAVVIGASALDSSNTANASGGGVAIGYNTQGAANYGIAIGSTANAGLNGTYNTSNIAIGYGATAFRTGTFAGSNAIAIGTSANAAASAAATSSGVAIGSSATALGNSIAIGPNAYAQYDGGLALGYNALTDFDGQMVVSTGSFAARGDMAVGSFPMWTYTTGATATEMGVGAGTATTVPTNFIQLLNHSSYMFVVQLVAQTQGGTADSAIWNITFGIQRKANALGTAIIGSVTGAGAPLQNTAGASSWSVGVTADTTNGRPAIKVTGAASTNISWVANVTMTKVGY